MFAFDNSWHRDLTGLYAPWQAAQVPAPALVRFNHALADQLGIAWQGSDDALLAALFCGNHLPAGAQPLAQYYAGHQFGQFNPALGDGRALLLGEHIDPAGRRWDVQLKGSGRTPFSRGGDGKAALGPVLREYLISEAMAALGVPTTRALAAVTTGETIMRDRPLPGAVLCRIAASHARIGTFQYFAANGEVEQLRRLLDHAIARHYPQLAGADSLPLALLGAVAERQAQLVAQWMLIGFVHGVMNTDNMTISGETIDFGPCAFIDAYDPAAVFSSIDRRGRYAFASQPPIALWNLTRLAESLLPLMDGSDEKAAAEQLTQVLDTFPQHYSKALLSGLCAKLGWLGEEPGDEALVNRMFAAMAADKADFTRFFRGLCDLVPDPAADPAATLESWIGPAPQLAAWLPEWRARAGLADGAAMRTVNPLYVPRNHLVEAALAAAVDQGDMAPFDRLLDVLQSPFEDRGAAWEDYTRPAPEGFDPYVTYCGT